MRSSDLIKICVATDKQRCWWMKWSCLPTMTSSHQCCWTAKEAHCTMNHYSNVISFRESIDLTDHEQLRHCRGWQQHEKSKRITLKKQLKLYLQFWLQGRPPFCRRFSFVLNDLRYIYCGYKFGFKGNKRYNVKWSGFEPMTFQLTSSDMQLLHHPLLFEMRLIISIMKHLIFFQPGNNFI